MARTILFAWELGGGLGHLAPIAPVLGRLHEAGIRIVLAARDLSRARAIVGTRGIEFVQAPVKIAKSGPRVDPLRSYSHILYNSGFADFDEFAAMAEAWRHLFEYVRPDLVLCDHAPLALLVARAKGIPRAAIGTGFCCPPDAYPMPDFRPWLAEAEERLRRDEDKVTANVNRFLEEWSCEPIERLGQLFGEADECLLTTYAELDHYPQREGGNYWGPLDVAAGSDPVWPESEGKKAFAYLKQTVELPRILFALETQEVCSLVYVDRLPFRLRVRYESDRLRFAPAPVNLDAVGRQCDLAILSGGHGSTASLLLSGRPILQLPTNLEQALTGLAVQRMQAGLCVNPERPAEMPKKLQAMLESDEYAAGAATFAEKYCGFDRQEQLNRLVQRLCDLTGSPVQAIQPRIGNVGAEDEQVAPVGSPSSVQPHHARALPTDLAIVAVFFNPAGYRSTVENFRKFYANMQDQGIPLHAVELAFGDGPFYVADLPGVREARTADAMWQLERMTNHIIAGLPDRYTKVAWLDTDVFFENRNWFRETSEALDQYQVIQPFRDAVWLKEDGSEMRRLPGVVHAMTDSRRLACDPAKIHPGFAWAARRELIGKHGLPDFSILGGADRILANAVFDVEWAREMSYFPLAVQQRIRDWRTQFSADVKDRAGHLNGAIYHLWHGSLAHRKYHVRNLPLLAYDFDPAVDIRVGDDGAWHWASEKPGLHEAVREYFFSRRSDG